jgi:hypothetical protein
VKTHRFRPDPRQFSGTLRIAASGETDIHARDNPRYLQAPVRATWRTTITEWAMASAAARRCHGQLCTRKRDETVRS